MGYHQAIIKVTSNGMNKKLVIVGVVLLIALGGGIFLWQKNQKEKENQYNATPTTWSQAGEYKITESPDGTLVQNQKAGFSFKVPEGWKIKDESDGVDYSLNLLSPEVKFDPDNFLLEGCFMSIETIFDKASVSNVRASIQYANKDLSEKIVQIGPYQALQRTISPSVVSTDPEVLKKVRDVVQVELPINEEILVSFILNTKKDYTERCLTFLNQTLSQISF
ncbi:MAG: hypothetical protein Greene071421_467 [Parcubacteria group bacterium Greene0714_21]|nr:MAG: hypothetical protein Greene041639_120 [Parcubacteria group bacterium Greene0416_39]TSC97443.1 MAG: hypothetical protein Greene101447_487 [Parcubacteria group bacterium Greene1014_47]TSD04101.1 MAG: hypothetical protein Greene071421_467 [Parcubacteria group bacterium Greene0714_21]